ncbi:hypothetical protein DV738_g4593, partial [Chaetothyriales sp. CBS 135597]
MAALPDLGQDVDIETFSQILEMDDDEADREFSKSIVWSFFEQAEQTFENIQAALEARDLDELRSLGHFLKGSSATIGLTRVKDSCEFIQRYGARENLDGTAESDQDICLRRITERFDQLKDEYESAKRVLNNFYGYDDANEN